MYLFPVPHFLKVFSGLKYLGVMFFGNQKRVTNWLEQPIILLNFLDWLGNVSNFLVKGWRLLVVYLGYGLEEWAHYSD